MGAFGGVSLLEKKRKSALGLSFCHMFHIHFNQIATKHVKYVVFEGCIGVHLGCIWGAFGKRARSKPRKSAQWRLGKHGSSSPGRLRPASETMFRLHETTVSTSATKPSEITKLASKAGLLGCFLVRKCRCWGDQAT